MVKVVTNRHKMDARYPSATREKRTKVKYLEFWPAAIIGVAMAYVLYRIDPIGWAYGVLCEHLLRC